MKSGKSRSADSKLPENSYCGRFAPSPTGPLHLGSLYTALAGYLRAKSRQGQWLLRIDDADIPRNAPGAIDSIKRTLDVFALRWDGNIVYQSHEFEAYQGALDRLDEQGLIFPCTCSRKTLSTRHSSSARGIYPGTCRDARRSRLEPHALRVRIEDGSVEFKDLLQGLQSSNLADEVGDFIVYRRDRIFAYHLATVVDDWRSGVTEVLRGYDLLDSTPPQIYLQRLLGLPTPEYLHIPVIVDRAGIKLSKQNLAQAVDERRPSPILLTLLRLLGQSPPVELTGASPEEILDWAIPRFDISGLFGASVTEPDATEL